jgi:hypothetical protein
MKKALLILSFSLLTSTVGVWAADEGGGCGGCKMKTAETQSCCPAKAQTAQAECPMEVGCPMKAKAGPQSAAKNKTTVRHRQAGLKGATLLARL